MRLVALLCSCIVGLLECGSSTSQMWLTSQVGVCMYVCVWGGERCGTFSARERLSVPAGLCCDWSVPGLFQPIGFPRKKACFGQNPGPKAPEFGRFQAKLGLWGGKLGGPEGRHQLSWRPNLECFKNFWRLGSQTWWLAAAWCGSGARPRLAVPNCLPCSRQLALACYSCSTRMSKALDHAVKGTASPRRRSEARDVACMLLRCSLHVGG
jgi:hypothetical protein